MKKFILTAATFGLLASIGIAGDTAVSSDINPDGLSISADPTVTIGAQTITGAGVATSAPVDFAVTVTDLRGTTSAITVEAIVTQLNDGAGHTREVSVHATSFSGDSGGVAGHAATVSSGSTPVTEANFITAPAKVNRIFGATVTVIGQPLSLANSYAGTYAGTITLTAN